MGHGGRTARGYCCAICGATVAAAADLRVCVVAAYTAPDGRLRIETDVAHLRCDQPAPTWIGASRA